MTKIKRALLSRSLLPRRYVANQAESFKALQAKAILVSASSTSAPPSRDSTRRRSIRFVIPRAPSPPELAKLGCLSLLLSLLPLLLLLPRLHHWHLIVLEDGGDFENLVALGCLLGLLDGFVDLLEGSHVRETCQLRRGHRSLAAPQLGEKGELTKSIQRPKLCLLLGAFSQTR